MFRSGKPLYVALSLSATPLGVRIPKPQSSVSTSFPDWYSWSHFTVTFPAPPFARSTGMNALTIRKAWRAVNLNSPGMPTTRIGTRLWSTYIPDVDLTWRGEVRDDKRSLLARAGAALGPIMVWTLDIYDCILTHDNFNYQCASQTVVCTLRTRILFRISWPGVLWFHQDVVNLRFFSPVPLITITWGKQKGIYIYYLRPNQGLQADSARVSKRTKEKNIDLWSVAGIGAWNVNHE